MGQQIVRVEAGGSSEVDTTGAQQAVLPTMNTKVVDGDNTKRNILLVGTSGRGKSATGNSVFGSEAFETSDSMDTDPDSIVCETREVDGLKLTICDALTIQDERMIKFEAEADIKTRLKKCFDTCPEGFHFIIFVFSYTERVTPEESVAAEILTNVFGERFLTQQAICVFTHGENFDLQRNLRGGPDFDIWHRNTQDPLLQKVSQNMNGFMFYNIQTEKMAKQRQKILETVQSCIICVRREQHGFITVEVRPNDGKSPEQQQPESLHGKRKGEENPTVDNGPGIGSREQSLKGDFKIPRMNDETKLEHEKALHVQSKHVPDPRQNSSNSQNPKRRSKSSEATNKRGQQHHKMADDRPTNDDQDAKQDLFQVQNMKRKNTYDEVVSKHRNNNNHMGIGGQSSVNDNAKYHTQRSSHAESLERRSFKEEEPRSHQEYTGCRDFRPESNGCLDTGNPTQSFTSEPNPTRASDNTATMAKVGRQDSVTQTSYGNPTSNKEWNLILVCNKEKKGKETWNALLGRKKNWKPQWWKSSKVETCPTIIDIDEASLSVVDGRRLMSKKKTDEKELELTENILKGSFKHFSNGFHAIVFVLSRINKLKNTEIKTVTLLTGMLGENVIRDHCILLCPFGEKLAHENLTPESWRHKQDGTSLGALITECQNRVVFFYTSMPKKREESIKRLTDFFQAIRRPYTYEMFEEASPARNRSIKDKQSPQRKD